MVCRVGKRRLVTLSQGAWWAAPQHRLDGVIPGFALDVRNQRYALGGAPRAIGDLISVSNAAPGTYIDNAGVLRQAAADTPRIDWTNGVPELLLEGAITNKVTCRKHNPTNTSNISITGDAAAILSVVDDTAALISAGLYDICTNGYVYKLDNSAGLTAAVAYPSGTSGNTNSHVYQCYMRGGTCQLGPSDAARLTVPASPIYIRRAYVGTPGVASSQLAVCADAGQIVYFVLPHFAEASVAGSIIPGSTLAAVTRTTDVCTLSSLAAAVLQGAGAAVAWRGGAVATSAYQTLFGVVSGRGLYLSGGDPAIIGIDSPAAPLAIAATAIAPTPIGAAFGWGASGRRGASTGQTVVSSSTLFGASTSTFAIGNVSSGLSSGQILRVRQVVGWSLPDRPSPGGVQAQARAA